MTTAARANWVSSLTLFVTVAAAPFPFGSTDPAAVALWCLVLGVGVVAASTRGLRHEHTPLIALAVIVILAYAFVLHEQLSTQPWIASPHPLWGDAARVLGIAISPSVSIARNEPFFSLGAPLANMLAVICSFLVCIDRNRARQLLLIVAWSGTAYAIYGIISYLSDPTYILWREKLGYRTVLTATFVNRNTAAVYFGSCAILWILILSQHLRRQMPPGRIYWRSVPRILLFEMPRPVILAIVMLLLCLTAMLMTGSRAGIVLSLMGVVVAFVIYFYRDLPRASGVLATLGIGAFIALLFLQILGGKVSGRFDTEGLSDEGRFDVYRSSLRMIADHPWFGSGLGTFSWSFPAYRSDNISLWGVWNRAHSTPLELATDLGLPLTTIIAVAWAIVLAVLARGIRIRRRDLAVPVGGLMVALLGLTHSFIDFSMQISGFSIIVFALVGAGLAQSFSSMSSKVYYADLDENIGRQNT